MYVIMKSVMFAIHFLNELTLLHLNMLSRYLLCMSCSGVNMVKLGKNYCFPETDDEKFLNKSANIWNVETCIITMLLYRNHMKTSSIFHMYHYSLSSVHKLLTDLTKHGKSSKAKRNIKKPKPKQKETLSLHYLYIKCMYLHMYIYMYTCTYMCV